MLDLASIGSRTTALRSCLTEIFIKSFLVYKLEVAMLQ